MLVEPQSGYLDSRPAPVRLEAERVAVGDFDRIISTFDGAVQELTTAFASMRWPELALEPWVFQREGVEAAAALVMVWRIPLLSCSIAVSKWGPILADETAPDCKSIYEAAVNHLMAEYADRRGMTLSIMARAEQEPALSAIATLTSKGFWLAAPQPFPSFYFVRVLESDALQRRSFAQKWRYHLSKSEQQQLEFEVASLADLPRFQALYEAMSERKRFPDYSAYETLPHLMKTLPDELKPRLFFVRAGADDVAVGVIFPAGRTAVYLYGATTAKALPLRAGYFMHARIVSWLREHTRAEWYDLGGSDGFLGLHQFKKGMVGSTGRIAPVPPVANYASHSRARIVGRAVYLMREMLQRYRRMRNAMSAGLARPDQEPGS